MKILRNMAIVALMCYGVSALANGSSEISEAERVQLLRKLEAVRLRSEAGSNVWERCRGWEIKIADITRDLQVAQDVVQQAKASGDIGEIFHAEVALEIENYDYISLINKLKTFLNNLENEFKLEDYLRRG